MSGFIALAFVVLTPSQQPAASGACRAAVVERQLPARNATAAFYDQGRDSIATLHPRHRLFAARQTGLLGRIEYSVIAYQPETSAPVAITALAVDWDARRAWSIDSSCEVAAWAGGLIDAITAAGARPGRTQPSADAVLIEAVRSTVAREIDPLLPPVSFDRWLSDLFGSQVRMQWEVNDCGEQTGDPALDRGRDIPTCVQVRAELAGNRTAVLLLSAGSQQKRPAGAPGYHFGVLMSSDRSQQEIRRLTDLRSAIKAFR